MGTSRYLIGLNGVVLLPHMELFKKAVNYRKARFIGTLDSIFQGAGKLKEDFPDYYENVQKCGRWPVIEHGVFNADELHDIVGHYCNLAASDKMTCYFRGQTKEYVDSQKIISVQPAAYRSEFIHEFKKLESPVLSELTGTWIQTIEKLLQDELGISWNNLISANNLLDNAQKSYGGFAPVSIINNYVLLAIAMHYGCPTPSLDVTPDINTAKWFCSNIAKTSKKGIISYKPVRNLKDSVIYIYFHYAEAETVSINLAALAQVNKIFYRPFRQSASAFPFIQFEAVHFVPEPYASRFGLSDLATLTRHETPRYPIAVIRFDKDFDLGGFNGQVDQGYFFPVDDPLYVALKKKNAKHLALYD